MKKILLLGGSAQQVVAIKKAKELGYYTVLCDFLPDNPGQYEADKFYLVSTTDKAAVLKVAEDEGVSGVLAYASDPAAPTAAYVAEKMGLPGNPYNSVEILCNKDKFREFLANNGFNTPKARGYTDAETAINDLKNGVFQFPVIVKPVDSSGSKGATVLKSGNGIQDAVKKAFSFSRGERIVVEDFIEKKHKYLVGGDIFVVDDEVILWGLMNCHRDNDVNPLVPAGKSYPLELCDSDVENVKKVLKNIVARLAIRNGAMNVELIIDKNNRVWLIDVGPRSGGNMIPDLLGDIFDVDIAAMSVKAAMGIKISERPVYQDGCYATYNLHSKSDGIYKNITFSPELQSHIYRTCIYKKIGDKVERFTDASKCLGIIFLRFQSKAEMIRVLANINESIDIGLQ